MPLSDLLRQTMARTRTWTAASAEVERERTRQIARVGNNLNQIARWANTHASAIDTAPAAADGFRRPASRRISSARPHNGTRCSRCAFIRASGTVHIIALRSNSSHVASRTSADRAAVSTWNSNASFARSGPATRGRRRSMERRGRLRGWLGGERSRRRRSPGRCDAFVLAW